MDQLGCGVFESKAFANTARMSVSWLVAVQGGGLVS